MNGFSIAADSQRRLVEQGILSAEKAQREIEILDFLATCDTDDFFRMVDSSAFNDIIRTFCKKALQNAEVDKQTEEKVIRQLEWLFDSMQAKDVCI